jgi:hypothetical protein
LRGFTFAVALVILDLLGGCSINDAHTALRAQKSLIGMKEVDLETCMGAPDEKSTYGSTDILTYYATSTSSTSISIPVIGGVGDSYGGYCHTVIRLDHGVVDSVRYTGETNAFVAPDAYCAPTVRGCVRHPTKPLNPAPAKASASAYWGTMWSGELG